MTLAPRFLVNFWAGYRVAKIARRLKTAGRGLEAQAAVFARLMAQTAGTGFGRSHGLTAVTTYAQFRDKVPPRLPGYFAPFVARMQTGEAGVLAPGRCHFFVETAGTTGEKPQLLPVPEPMLAHFRDGLRDSLCLYAVRAGHAGVFLGRHLHLGASTALREENASFRTGLDGLLALCLTPWAEANLYAPPPAIARLAEGPEKTAAAVQAMLPHDVTLVAGNPAAVCALAQAACEAGGTGQRRQPHLQAVWPNLECFAFTGAPLGFYQEALRTSLGPTVAFHELYAAAEGVYAAQDAGTPAGLRLLTDAGVFFEFLPLRSFKEDKLDQAGAECLPLGKVQPGTDYVLVVTTPAGLCRLVPGDIVRFLSVDPPRLQFAGRTKLQLDTLGERVTERELTDTLLAVCARNGWQAVNFHVAPCGQRIAAGQTVNHHEWWVELRTHSMKTPTGNVLAPELDAELARRNADYATRRAQRTLEACSVRLVIPGIFDQWMKAQSRSGGAGKTPRCRPDRLIADQLATLTHFYQPTTTPFAPADPNSPA